MAEGSATSIAAKPPQKSPARFAVFSVLIRVYSRSIAGPCPGEKNPPVIAAGAGTRRPALLGYRPGFPDRFCVLRDFLVHRFGEFGRRVAGELDIERSEFFLDVGQFHRPAQL